MSADTEAFASIAAAVDDVHRGMLHSLAKMRAGDLTPQEWANVHVELENDLVTLIVLVRTEAELVKVAYIQDELTRLAQVKR